MKVVTVGYFDSPTDYTILDKIKKLIICERLIIYLFTDRIKLFRNNILEFDYLTRRFNLHKKLLDLNIKFYLNPFDDINLLDSPSIDFLRQYEMKDYLIILPENFKFNYPQSNVIYFNTL